MAGFGLIRRVQPRPSLLPLGPFCVASGGVASSPNTEDKDRGTRGGVFRAVEVMATLRHCPDRKSKTTVLTPTPSCPTNREVPPSLPRGRRSWAPLPSTSIHSMRSVPTGIASQDKERPFASSLLRALRSLFAAVPKARHPPPLGPPIGYGTDSAVRRAVIFFLNHRTDRCSLPHFLFW